MRKSSALAREEPSNREASPLRNVTVEIGRLHLCAPSIRLIHGHLSVIGV